GRSGLCKKMGKSKQKSNRIFEDVLPEDEINKLREENICLLAQLNQLKENQKMNEQEDSLSWAGCNSGEVVAPDDLPSEMILVRIPLQLRDNAFYCATCNFKSNKRNVIIRHTCVHQINHNRELSVSNVQPKVLNKERITTQSSYQCPEC
ncbi:unnamed protein product, partial [Meganyctiphanes norvegica]